jgi:hypothetical protein
MDRRSSAGEAKLGDYIDGMKGRASPEALRRLRNSCRHPQAEIRSFLADIEAYARKKWELHHLPDWSDVKKLLNELHSEELLTDGEFESLRYLPDKDRVEAALGLIKITDEDAFELKMARHAQKVLEQLSEMFPEQRSRVESVPLASFKYRYECIRNSEWPNTPGGSGPAR